MIRKIVDLKEWILSFVYSKDETCNREEIGEYVVDKVDELSDEVDVKLAGKSNVGHTHVKANITDLGAVSSGGDGLMTVAQFNKLNGIENNANRTVVDNEMNPNSRNPVENRVICETYYDKDDIIDLLNNIETSSGKLLTIYVDEDTGDLVIDDDDYQYYTKDESDARFNINVEKQQTAESGYLATYVVKQNGSVKGAKINIPKDFVLKSGSVKTCTTPNVPVQGYKVGDKYLDFVLNAKDSSGNDEHIYLLVSDLVDLYTADEVTLTLDSNNVFKVKDGGIGATQLDNAILNTIANKVDKVTGKALSTNDYTNAEKNKLANIEVEANNYIHPSYTARTGKPTTNQTPAFGGTVTVSQITSDASGHVTGATDRTITIPSSTATTSANGLMSSADKTKLDGIATGANKYVHPSYTAKSNGLYKVTVDNTGHVSEASAVTGGDLPSHTHSINNVTGLQSALDDKLDSDDYDTVTMNVEFADGTTGSYSLMKEV